MKSKGKVKNVIKITLYSLFLIGIVLFALVMLYVHNTLKSVKHLDMNLDNNQIKTVFYDNNDNILVSSDLTSNKIELSDINDYTKNAFISIEDKEFYNHNGLNYKRIIKASLNNLKSMSFKEGASTITQQLVKNRYLTNDKTIDRKIKEAYLSIKLEKQESKDKILETYLNSIYFGNGAYGIYDASKLFFNKLPNELTISESCVLAGSIKAPSLYSPINNIENSTSRRNLILGEMLDDGYINNEEYNNAIAEEIIIADNNYSYSKNDLYNDYVINEASEILNVSKNNVMYGGYKIYTYKDAEIQKLLDKNIYNMENYHINSFGNIADSLGIVIDNSNYTVSAISGKSDYSLLNIKRQPGSLIKPIFTYAPAIEEKEIYLCSEVLDEEINIDNYSPKNVGDKYYGYVNIKDAIAKSLNIPAVKITKELGIDTCKKYAKKSGIDFANDDTGYALALGGMTDGVTLKNITDSYSIFTSGGKYIKSTFIKKITNTNNITLYDRKMSESNVLSTDTSYLMTNTLEYAVKTGTSKKLSKLPYSVAGKTGTVAVKDTNLNTDAYSLAYTNNHTMSVWLGNYTMQKEYNLEGSNNGGTYATKIILDTFEELYKDNPPTSFLQPKSVIEKTIDSRSLKEDHVVLLGDNVPERYQVKELFSVNNIPKKLSHKFNKIDTFEFEIIEHKNSVAISFDCKDYIDYKIYRLCNNKSSLLKTISNTDGIYEYVDKDIEPNISYSYYIVADSDYSDENYITNKCTIKLKKEFNELLQSEDNTNWIFS